MTDGQNVELAETSSVRAPDFELVDTEGQVFRLSALQGKRSAVLVFNRGFL